MRRNRVERGTWGGAPKPLRRPPAPLVAPDTCRGRTVRPLRAAGAALWVAIAALVVPSAPADAQIRELLGPHVVETLAYEIPGTGRIGGVTLDAFGYLYVANQDERVWKLHPSGEVELFIEGLYGSASGVPLPDGSILHSSYNDDRVVHIRRDGTVESVVTEGLEGPVGMVRVGEAVYVTNAKADWIARIGPDGSVHEHVRDPRFRIPNGITADPDGNLYVVGIGNTIVMRIGPEGELTEVATLPGRSNAHVAWAQGGLYVTQIWDNVVLRVELDGSYQVVAGDGSQRAADGPTGQSRVPFPNGITASRSGDVLYFNTLEGPMVAGRAGTIRVHALHPPGPNRLFQSAWRVGGADAMRDVLDRALRVRELTPEQVIGAAYDAARHMLERGMVEPGLLLTEWVAEADENQVRASMNLASSHHVHGDAALALRSAERAAELQPDDADVARLLEVVRVYAAARR